MLVEREKRENKKRRVRKTKSVEVGVAMERHKCKLCSRTFGNGRALGGHMKAHLAIAKSQQKQFTQPGSFSSSESEEDEEEEEKALINYVLRENPKKSLKVADPEFSFIRETESVIVQDRESETESKNNPTRQQRSKRNRKQNNNSQNFLQQKKPKPSFMVPTTPSQFIEQEPVSSVSDTSPEEDVAMCLMMLSRDKWSRKMNNINNVEQNEEEEEGSVEKISKMKLLKRVRGKHLCENCGKTFRSSRALGSHRSICCHDEAKNGNDDKIFECPFCFKVFGSGQALGGHKRSHLMIPSSSTSTANVNVNVNVNPSAARFKESFIDLNMPAPLEEDDDLSVVSDA